MSNTYLISIFEKFKDYISNHYICQHLRQQLLLVTASSREFGFFVSVETNFIILGRNFLPYFGNFFNGSFANNSCSFLACQTVAPTDGIGYWNNIEITTDRVSVGAPAAWINRVPQFLYICLIFQVRVAKAHVPNKPCHC